MAATTDRGAWSILKGWLETAGSSATDLQKALLRQRLEAGDESPLLAKALRAVAEATSAGWPADAVREEIARLIDPTVLTAPDPSMSVNGTTVTVQVAVSQPVLKGIRVD